MVSVTGKIIEVRVNEGTDNRIPSVFQFQKKRSLSLYEGLYMSLIGYIILGMDLAGSLSIGEIVLQISK